MKAVIFTSFTTDSELAKSIRQAEERLEVLTGYRLKVVERPGSKLEDILTKSNPWQGQDCGRQDCLLCQTKEKTGENKGQDCCKRSLVYEIWCMECKEKEEKKLVEIFQDEKILKEKKKEIRLFKYIGETSRSAYERSLEHQLSLKTLNSDSYMLKHLIDKHEGEDMEVQRFGIKVVKFTKSSFERQILESVTLQENRRHFL